MKKTGIVISLVFCFVAFGLIACGDGREHENHSGENANDSMLSTPSAIDTVQHPNGITSGSVISRDTAAMRPDTVQRR